MDRFTIPREVNEVPDVILRDGGLGVQIAFVGIGIPLASVLRLRGGLHGRDEDEQAGQQSCCGVVSRFAHAAEHLFAARTRQQRGRSEDSDRVLRTGVTAAVRQLDAVVASVLFEPDRRGEVFKVARSFALFDACERRERFVRVDLR